MGADQLEAIAAVLGIAARPYVEPIQIRERRYDYRSMRQLQQ